MKQIKRCDPRVRRKCPDAGFCKGVFMEGSECDSLQQKLAEQVARREARLIDANSLRTDYLKKHRMTDTEFDLCYPWWQFSQAIANAPTVDAAPVVHGRWIDGYAVDSNSKKVYDSIDCSVCEEVYKIETHDREYWKGRFKQCFCCGAKMDL